MNEPGCLYVVATPIGNLEDITQRAARILCSSDLVACEDTRTSGRLLRHLGSSTPMISYHEHNEGERSGELVRRLAGGESIALISDAGTPLLSDPGYRLVSLCRKEGIPVVPVPGPSASTSALSVSGLPTDRFLFAGFLPKSRSGQERMLDSLQDTEATLVFYIPVHSARQQIELIIQRLGDRPAFLAREMTKLHETYIHGTLSEVLDRLSSETLKGEVTLLVGGTDSANESTEKAADFDLHAYLYGLIKLRGLSGKDAVAECVRQFGLPKKEVYGASLEIKKMIEAGEAQ